MNVKQQKNRGIFRPKCRWLQLLYTKIGEIEMSKKEIEKFARPFGPALFMNFAITALFY